MKIQAKEIKKGDTVKYGNVWVKVEDIKQRFQKNGKPYLILTGTRLAGKVNRRSSWVKSTPHKEIKGYKISYKNETFVQVK